MIFNIRYSSAYLTANGRIETLHRGGISLGECQLLYSGVLRVAILTNRQPNLDLRGDIQPHMRRHGR